MNANTFYGFDPIQLGAALAFIINAWLHGRKK